MGPRARITVERLDSSGQRVTSHLGETLEETQEIIAEKLGFGERSRCRIYNKHGAQIDSQDLLHDNDLVYATDRVEISPFLFQHLQRTGSKSSPLQNSQAARGPPSTITPSAASTIQGDADVHCAKGNDFVIGQLLGSGGQGTTFLTTDRRSGQKAVLKQIFCTSLAQTNKAIVEAVMLSKLKHPRVVSYSEVFLGSDPATKGNYVGIVMEYCSGGDLFQALCKQRTKKKPISQRRVKMWIVQLCQALSYLHSQQVIHRDVKPMNVLLDSEGNAKMADFGLARQLGVAGSGGPVLPAHTQCGTPGYESPEVQLGLEYDEKTDIWGLGCVLCDMTTLRFMHERPGSLATQVQVNPEVLGKLLLPIRELYGPDIRQLLASMLSPDPLKRPSAAQLLRSPILQPVLPCEREPAVVSGPGSASPPALPSLSAATRPPNVGSHQSSSAAQLASDDDSSRGSPRAAASSERSGRRTPVQLAGTPAAVGSSAPAAVGGGGGTPERTRKAAGGGLLAGQVGTGEVAVPGPSGEWGGGHSPQSPQGASKPRSEVLVVCKRPEKHEFGSIAEALKRSKPGGVVEVRGGIYQEELLFGRDVTLVARSAGEKVEIHSMSRKAALTLATPGVTVTVRGFKVMHFSKHQREGKGCTRAVEVAAGCMVVEECAITSLCGVGVGCHSGARVQMLRCKVTKCGQNGVFMYEDGSGVVDDCDLVENAFPGLGLDEVTDFTMTGSRVVHGRGDGVKIRAGGEGILLLDNEISHNGQVGVSMEDGASPVLRGNHIHHGGSCGVSIMTGARGLVEGNHVYGNAHPNVYIASGADPEVRGNSIHHSLSCGVTVVEGGRGLIESNDIYGNVTAGVYVMSGGDPTVRRNIIHDGEGDGIKVCLEGRGMYEQNTVRRNGGFGVLIETRADATVCGNVISESAEDGVHFSQGARGLLERNTIDRACACGILVDEGSCPTIVANDVSDCAGGGILVSGGSSGCVERNTVARHGSHGIAVVLNSSPTVLGNVVTDNKGLGLLVAQGSRGVVEGNMLAGNQEAQGSQIKVEKSCSAVVKSNVEQ